MKKTTYFVPDVRDAFIKDRPKGAVVKVLMKGQDTYNEIPFTTKRQARQYLRWLQGDPTHPIHKVKLELAQMRGEWVVTDVIQDYSF
jgi:hypothetical protein